MRRTQNSLVGLYWNLGSLAKLAIYCSVAAFAGHFTKSNSDTMTYFDNPAIVANLVITALIAVLAKYQPT